MTDPRWYVLVGFVFVAVAVTGTLTRRLPLTGSIIYLGVGVLAGPAFLGLITLDDVESAPLLEVLTELAVIVSLFTAGLKLRDRIRSRRWHAPVRLAFVSMTITVGLIAAVGTLALGLEPGAAILLGAILAPTDPVLASDVQVERPTDRDELRFKLTAEAGLNDGTAFPFVLLGLGLLGLGELGDFGIRWLAVDVFYAVTGGLLIGVLLGTLVTRLVLYLRRTYREALGLDEFLCLGLIALAYGVALLLHTYAFLAVFAAGLAVRRIERVATDAADLEPERLEEMSRTAPDEAETDPTHAPAFVASSLLEFNERLERIAEAAIVVVLGALLARTNPPPELVWFVPMLFLVIRPFGVLLGLIGSGVGRRSLALIGWFGIRGIGSIYYLSHAITHGIEATLANQLSSLVLWTVVLSIVIHGVSVTPIMTRYDAWRQRRSGGRTRRGAPDAPIAPPPDTAG